MNTFNITLDISKNHRKPNKLVTIGQGDTGGTTIVATVTEGGSQVSLTGMTVYFMIRLPDGIHYAKESCTVSDGKAVYVSDESKVATVSGYTDEAYFEIQSGGKVYSTERFRVKVLRSASADARQSGDASLGSKTITANGTYSAASDNLDGYSKVVVTVQNSYSVADVGKVVSSNSLVTQGTSTFTANATYDTTYIRSVTVSVPTGGTMVTGSASVSSNGTYLPTAFGFDAFAAVTVNVPNTFSAADNGKVVSGSSLVQQGTSTLNSNSVYNTTYVSSVTVSVPNTYSAADAGKVVSNGQLVAQGSSTYTANATYDTTLISSVTVNVQGGGTVVTSSLTATQNGTYNPASYDCDAFSQVVVSVSGGGGGGFTADDIAERTIAGDISGSASSVNSYAFTRCSFITAANFPSCKSIGSSAFQYCYALTVASFPSCTRIGNSAFYNCSALTVASFPSCTSIANTVFFGCHKLTSFYLNDVSQVTTLGATTFDSTPIVDSSYLGGEYGSVFVPSSLYDAFCAAAGWSSISARLVSI